MNRYTEVKQFPDGRVAIRLWSDHNFEDETRRWVTIGQRPTVKGPGALDMRVASDDDVAEATTMIPLTGGTPRR
jgi:hypothetical protein